MNYVGIDLHRDFFVACAQDDRGNVLFNKRYENNRQSVTDLIAKFSSLPKVVVEATRNWMWFIAELQTLGCEVILAHPFRTKAIASARIKTDSIDAKTLCDLLRADLIPQSYIANPNELDNREIARGRICLVHDQTVLKNRILAILGKDNLRFDGTDTFGVNGKAWLNEQQMAIGKRHMIDTYLSQLEKTKEQIKRVETIIKQRSGNFPEVKLLQTIPGLGTITAFLLASEIGDVKRFPSSKKFASYFGLVPRLSQSGNHAYYGRITKLGNPYVRWILVQASHRLVRANKDCKKFVDRLSHKHGKKKAIVALARKMATIAYSVLKEDRVYEKNHKPKHMSSEAVPLLYLRD